MHTLKVYYRPDDYPHWLPWKEFTQQAFEMIGEAGQLDLGGKPLARPGFAPRVPFGKPANRCDITGRNLRRGYSFQVRFVGSGHVIINRFRIHAQRQIEKSTAK